MTQTFLSLVEEFIIIDLRSPIVKKFVLLSTNTPTNATGLGIRYNIRLIYSLSSYFDKL